MFSTTIFSYVVMNNPASTGAVSYIYCMFVFLIAIKAYDILGGRLLGTLQIASILLLIALYVKMFIYHGPILQYMRNPVDDHPEGFPVFTSLNLEATWITLSLALFIRKQYFLLIWIAVVLLDLIYSSRVSLVLALMIFGLKLLSQGKVAKRLMLLAILLPLIVASVAITNPHIYLSFLTATEKGGLVSRFVMWKAAPEAILEWDIVTGYGAQNAIYALDRASSAEFSEGNVHNLFLQMLLDGGVIGFILYLCLFVYIVRCQFRCGFKNEAGNYLIAYLVGSLVQFQGVEAQMWLVLGLYSSMLHARISEAPPNMYGASVNV